MLKCIRNNWLNLKSRDKCFNYPQFNDKTLGQYASFSLLRAIYQKESKDILKEGYTFNFQSMFPNSLERQKVNLALRIFNEKSFSAIKKP